MNLALRMLAALVVGLGGGILATTAQWIGTDTILAVARPVGSLWLDGLTMTIVPLVFGLIVTGIYGAAREASASRLATRSLLWFAILLIIASALGAAIAETILHFWPIAGSAALIDAAPVPVDQAGAVVSHWYDGIVPSNIVRAAADTAVVPLVVFALLFGLALSRIEAVLAEAMLAVVRALVEAMLVIVHWILWLAPIGIAALAFAAGVQMGSAAAGALGLYMVVASAACLAATAMAYVAAATAGAMSPIRFARAALPAQSVALGTQSSLATLPVMFDSAERIGASPQAAGVVLPLAVSLFRAASAAANVAVAVYLAHLHGIELTIPMLLLGVLIAVPVSLAAVGVAAQVSFVATIAPICVALDIPIVALPLLMAVESIPDLFRTLGNVTADLTVVRIVGRSGGQTPQITAES